MLLPAVAVSCLAASALARMFVPPDAAPSAMRLEGTVLDAEDRLERAAGALEAPPADLGRLTGLWHEYRRAFLQAQPRPSAAAAARDMALSRRVQDHLRRLVAQAESSERALPDLQLDTEFLKSSLYLDEIDAAQDPCLVREQCLLGPGRRRVLRFSTRVWNRGAGEAVVGVVPNVRAPTADTPWWEWDTCHAHWHYTGYATYAVSDGTANLVEGRKNGFCLMDSICPLGDAKYDCTFQGISPGCGDTYEAELACQWVDITDLAPAPGPLFLNLTINAGGALAEARRDNNVALIPLDLAAVPTRITGYIKPPRDALVDAASQPRAS